MRISRRKAKRCACGCYPVERWWPFAKCYVVECYCCKKNVMHKRIGTARLQWYRLVSEFLTPEEESIVNTAISPAPGEAKP